MALSLNLEEYSKAGSYTAALSVTFPDSTYSLVQETVKRLQQTAESNQVTLELTGSPITVRGVRQMLDEATFNLCENAIKYNRPGGHVQISISSSAEGAQVRVSDDGIGIDPDDQAHILERFYRADKSH